MKDLCDDPVGKKRDHEASSESEREHSLHSACFTPMSHVTTSERAANGQYVLLAPTSPATLLHTTPRAVDHRKDGSHSPTTRSLRLRSTPRFAVFDPSSPTSPAQHATTCSTVPTSACRPTSHSIACFAVPSRTSRTARPTITIDPSFPTQRGQNPLHLASVHR